MLWTIDEDIEPKAGRALAFIRNRIEAYDLSLLAYVNIVWSDRNTHGECVTAEGITWINVFMTRRLLREPITTRRLPGIGSVTLTGFEETLVFVLAHEHGHYLLDTGQIPGKRDSETQANIIARRWLLSFREDENNLPHHAFYGCTDL